MSELVLLTEDEFDALTPDQQARYLDLLSAELGEPTPSPVQARAMALADEVDELLYGGAAGPGKALDLATPILTTRGWSTMGDLNVGDEVYGPDGQPTRIVAATAPMVDHECWRLTFDDGASIVADASHLWHTFTASDRAAITRRSPEYRERRRATRAKRGTGRRPDLAARNAAGAAKPSAPVVGAVRGTATIAESVKVGKRNNHSVPVAASIATPDVDLPIDPYVLGAWLGDGTAANGSLTTADPEVVDQFRAAGFEMRKWKARYAWGVTGLKAQLADAGLLNNKTIPDVYMRAGIGQRWALLEGLMDTDGTVDRRDGSVSFTATRESLAESVFALVLSLGQKPTLRSRPAKIDGRVVGTAYQVSWMSTRCPFRLARKAEHYRAPTRGVTTWRYIVAAEQVESRPVRCITVARADGMFLAGDHLIPTHNSWFMRHRAQALSRKYPGHKTLLLRESFPELRRTHIRDAIAQYAAIPAAERPVYKASTYEWSFPNDSVIEFGHAATDEDVRSYLSAEYDCIMVDESSEFSEYRLTMLRSRLRTSFTKASLGVKPHMILGSNPGGIGHKYHVDRFIKPTDYGEHVATITDEWNNRKVERTVAFVKARVTDNPHIDPGYIDNLISLPEALRKQYLEGDWDSFEGQFWSEFERERAGRPWHVIPPFEVPPDWPRIRGMDFGNAAPFCCLWVAFDHDGDAYVYREMYEKNVTAAEQARRVLKASVMREAGIPKPERIDYTMLDPACWSQHQPGQSIAMQYADEGLYARKGDNQRIAGWTRIRDYLAEDETGKPGLRVFATCTNLIDEMTNALYDKIHVEDLNTKKPDHAMDALRYALMSRPRSYTPKKPPPDMSMEAKVDRHFARMERRKKRRLPEGLGGL